MTFHYDVVAHSRAGHEREHRFASDAELHPGDVIRFSGRDWLVEDVEDSRLRATPARYRLRLRHENGAEEVGALRRWRIDAPRAGHAFTTLEDGHPVSWQVTTELLARDEDGEPYLALLAERDHAELEELPAHELEHVVARGESELPEAAQALFRMAEAEGRAVELVALESGDEPDWDEAAQLIDSLVIEEVEDDLVELCGVYPDSDLRETWIGTVKERLQADLESFRADIEGELREIEEWEFSDGRIFASVGTFADEANPLSGHGWMCRLLDSEALGAAGFKRVRRAQLQA